ncbi:MAG: hypothetical protein ACXVJD_12160 [Mucilaginibacter sp.]
MSTQQIPDSVNNISLVPASAEDHSKLCDIWPTVKEGLEILERLIRNPIVKGIINTVISAGDAIIGQICR